MEVFLGATDVIGGPTGWTLVGHSLKCHEAEASDAQPAARLSNRR